MSGNDCGSWPLQVVITGAHDGHSTRSAFGELLELLQCPALTADHPTLTVSIISIGRGDDVAHNERIQTLVTGSSLQDEAASHDSATSGTQAGTPANHRVPVQVSSSSSRAVTATSV